MTPKDKPSAHRMGWAWSDAKAANLKGEIEAIKKRTKKAIRRNGKQIIDEALAELGVGYNV